MRKPIVAFLSLLIGACASGATVPASPLGSPSADEQAALAVVARRTAAYNAHDIDAFLATYDERVRVYEYPEKFLGEGRDRMKKIFGPQFADNEGSIAVIRQHALGNVVVSDETVDLFGRVEHNIGIYTVVDGRIVEVRLIEPAE